MGKKVEVNLDFEKELEDGRFESIKKVVTFRELPPRRLIGLMDMLSQGLSKDDNTGDSIMALINVTLEKVSKGLDASDFLDLCPSDMDELKAGFMEANSVFLKAAGWLGILEMIQNQAQKTFKKWMSEIFEDIAAETMTMETETPILTLPKQVVTVAEEDRPLVKKPPKEINNAEEDATVSKTPKIIKPGSIYEGKIQPLKTMTQKEAEMLAGIRPRTAPILG